ncbi:MAG: class I SAM-dependent methyltransferase [Nanoarchaeota archaeon]
MNPKTVDGLRKQYASSLPSFYNNLSDNEISAHPCFNCLYETEKTVLNGDWKKLPAPIRYWYEMCDAESKFLSKFLSKNKPKTILEVGCGSGRIIRIILEIDYAKKIYAVDKDSKMVNLTKPLFKSQTDVHIENDYVEKFLQKHQKFDLIICMMNTLGNIDSQKTFESIVTSANHVLFTVYDKKYYHLRQKIYISKGHKDFSIKNQAYLFNDSWIRGLKSRSYTKEELTELCKKTNKEFTIKKISKLAYLVHIH